jgi:hypothetical protein
MFDYLIVAESSLDKVLRLAGGVTRSYTRTEPSGQRQLVRQYASRAAKPKTLVKQNPKSQAKPQSSGSAAFSDLKVGQVIQIQNQNYTVSQVNIPPSTGSGTSTGSQGTGLNTASTAAGAAAAATAQANAGAATAAQAAAKLFGTPQQDPALAALNGKTIPSNTAVVTNLLTNTTTGRYWYTRLPASFMVKVVG